MPSLYLAAAHADRHLAGRLRDALADRDVECRADDHRIADRGALPESLLVDLGSTAGLVVLASPAGLASPQVEAEVAYTVDRGYAEGIVVVTCGLDGQTLAARWPALAALGCHALPADPTDAELATAAWQIVVAARIGPRRPGELILDVDRFRIDGGRICARVRSDEHCGEFRAPLGPIEAEDLRWYLESYPVWPADVFEARAAGIVERLPLWGAALWRALLDAAGPPLGEWLSETHDRRLLTLRMAAPRPVPLTSEAAERLVARVGGDAQSRALILTRAARPDDPRADDRPPEVLAAQRAENAAQARFLALPWALLARDGGYLCQSRPPVAVRRVLVPRSPTRPPRRRHGPIRVLVVVARPERAGLIDPRASADALIDAVAPLGDAVQLDFVRPPTLAGLSEALHGRDYDALHFDGHGVYDTASGLGYLCFEHRDPQKRRAGEAELVDGSTLRHALGETPLPLAFLEACQTAQSGEATDSALATALIAAGAQSVVAMSHSVLVTTAARFTAGFYAALVDGESVAQATARARRALARDPNRGTAGHADALTLHDFHVPQLFQREDDPVLVPGGRSRGDGDADLRAQRHASLPDVRETHGHGFVGRLRERLAIERALETHRIALIQGIGGQGKTTLAAELGRWLVRCERFRAAAFVSVEQSPEIEGVLSRIGRALIGDDFVVEGHGKAAITKARDEIGTWLDRWPGLVIVDNFETLLPPPDDAPAAEALTHRPDLLTGMLDLLWDLCRRGESRVIVTCREPLGDRRFGHGRMCHVERLGGLDVRSAIALVGEICRNERVAVDAADDGALADMVQAVGCHPRALVVLPPLLRTHGVQAVTADLQRLMAELEAKHPGDRERSLLASVKLSLDRLPAKFRAMLPPLGLLRGGVSRPVLRALLALDEAQADALAEALAERGLVHPELDGLYLRFHPALTAVLEADPGQAEADDTLWQRIAVAYAQLSVTLHDWSNAPEHAAAVGLAVRELPNFSRVIDHRTGPAAEPQVVEGAIGLLTTLIDVLRHAPRRRALRALAERRDALDARLPDGPWSRARYLAACERYNESLAAGRMAEATALATHILEEVRRADGAGTLRGAGYAHARALFQLGRAHELSGRAERALPFIEQARAAFEALADDDGARRMVSTCITDEGNCLLALGRFGPAAERFRRSIALDQARGALRDVAINRGQLGVAHMGLGDLGAALAECEASRRVFEDLSEWGMVAAGWHQLGMLYERAGQLAEAEDAYKHAVALRLERGERHGAAETLCQLGNLAIQAERFADACAWYRRALDQHAQTDDPQQASLLVSNLALALYEVGELDEAEAAARRAIPMREALGVAAAPWRTWKILASILHARGLDEPARAAQHSARQHYRQYRLQGGLPDLAALQVFGPLRDEVRHARGERFAQALEMALPMAASVDHVTHRVRAMIAFARGDHAATRALLPRLDFADAVELELLLDGHWPDPTAAAADPT